MIERISASRKRQDAGFTLIELLVVIVILGILAAVVVFAVQGTGDRGAKAAFATDAETVRTAQEAFCAKNGRYATTSQQLVDGQFLSDPSTYHTIETAGVAGPCKGDSNGPSGYRITCVATEPGCSTAGGAIPRGGIIRVAGTSDVANVSGNNFVNPAVTSSGTVHPNVEYMYNGLLRWSPSNTIEPDLAQSFAVSPDQKTAAFTLRPGMVWHNGSPITANDVEFTVQEALVKFHSRTAASLGEALGVTNPNTASASTPANSIDCGNLADAVPTACSPTSLTVRFNFGFSYPTLLRQMNVTEAPILPEAVYGSCRLDGGGPGTDNINTSACGPNNPGSGDFPSPRPIGSGPFMFKSRNIPTSADLVFVKNPQYHFPGLPYADELRQVPTANSATSLLNGTIDIGSPPGNTTPPVPSGQTFTPTITPAAGFTVESVPRGSGGGNCITQPGFNLWAVGTTPATINALPANAAYTHPIFGDPTLVDPDGAGPLGMMQRGKVVRRAISMSLDRTLMFNANEFGKGRVPDSPLHSKLSVYSAQGNMPPFDRATAATWLENAGWTVQTINGVTARYSTGAAGMPAEGTPLSWPWDSGTDSGGSLRTTGNQSNYWTSINSQLLASPIEISANLKADGTTSERPARSSTQDYAPFFGNRKFDIITINYCQGDDPVVGARRQYYADTADGNGTAGSQISTANFSNAAGYRNSAVDALWDARSDAAFGSMQSTIADDAPYIWLAETAPQRAWRSSCVGFNLQNTGLFAEAASCPS